MGEHWGIELVQGIGKLFLNPLTYWIFILIILAGIQRTKKERKNFGIKIVDIFSEWKGTWGISIVSGILISGICIGIGIVFSYETLALFSIVSLLLSITLRFTMLSPSYTIGFTLLLLLFMPAVMENQSYFNENLFSDLNFVGVAILLGLLLLIESMLTIRISQSETYPDLVLAPRGKWNGFHHIKKLSVIPFFTLVPSGLIVPFAEYWPTISVNGESFGLILFPFIIGFDHTVKSVLPEEAARQIGKKIGLLGVAVLCLAVGSIYIWSLSIIAAVVAIVGREFITYKHRMKDNTKASIFGGNEQGLSVIAVISNTPAEKLGIQIGETVSKVNGKRVHNVQEFYQFLQMSGAFFKLEVLDVSGEVRLLQSAFYQNDHHELGLVFVKERYHATDKIKKA